MLQIIIKAYFKFKEMKNNINIHLVIAFILAFTLSACKGKKIETGPCAENYLKLDETKVLNKICFGSCGSHLSEQALLSVAANQNPDLYVFLGDNIYGDTENMDVMQEKYELLCSKKDFIALKKKAPFLATWDDHDFGVNDGGKEYPKKAESKQVFMEFWEETNNTERMAHEGIYDAKIIGEGDKRVQIILLDCRTFRTALKESDFYVYEQNSDPEASILGAAQWAWLEQQLSKPAEIRIIASSIQFVAEFNNSESWANFPLEQEKMYNLIESTNANGALLISGDVHHSDLSKFTPSNIYPLYDFTSSGITGTSTPSPNVHRIGNALSENNIGMIDIDWNGIDTKIKLSILNASENVTLEHTIDLSELQL